MSQQTPIQNLPGFRDLFPEDHARLHVITSAWRKTARRYGFVEYDAPTLELSSLYEKKNSGGELLEQLYRFEDRGGRSVCLRPEMTPSLARMVAARGSRAKKPIKWFSIARFFRYERQQKGRLREFLQFNCDVLGDASAGADAEVIALAVDSLRTLGLGSGDFVVRISDRNAWHEFLKNKGLPDQKMADFLTVVDRMEKEPEETLCSKLAEFGVTLDELKGFIDNGGQEIFRPLLADLEARGMQDFVSVDLRIVRGLAYYTGLVFEVFDRARSLRAVAGGGRYDHLVSSLSEGAAHMPAVGMGMGDVVLSSLIENTPAATRQMELALAGNSPCQIYVVIAAEEQRCAALEVVQTLRSAGRRVDFPLSPMKVGKQFQSAETAGATFAVLVGTEWPLLRVKEMATRTETELEKEALANWAQTAQF